MVDEDLVAKLAEEKGAITRDVIQANIDVISTGIHAFWKNHVHEIK